jgi:hypothetical protein
MVGDLLGELGLNSLEQVPTDDGRLLAGQDLTFEHDLADIEAIAQQMGERPAGKGNAADGLTSFRVRTLVTTPRLCRSAISRPRLPSR